MADVVITGTDIASSNPRGDGTHIAAENIDAGEEFYVKAADGLAYLASCDVDDPSAAAVGIAIGTGLTGQAFPYQIAGQITIGTHGVALGTLLFQSATAGKLAPEADLVSTNRKVIVGIVNTTTTFIRRMWNTGTVVP
jgi:hypothetical protein